MPPEVAAANDSTRTPKKSSSRFTPANPPLSAKTKVPVRSSMSGSLSMDGLSEVAHCGSCAEGRGGQPTPAETHGCLGIMTDNIRSSSRRDSGAYVELRSDDVRSSLAGKDTG